MWIMSFYVCQYSERIGDRWILNGWALTDTVPGLIFLEDVRYLYNGFGLSFLINRLFCQIGLKI